MLCAVVHPCDHDSLLGPLESARRGLIVPVLVGPEAKIRAVAQAAGADLGGVHIVNTEHSHEAAAKAVAMARAGEVQALMKGSLHTDELMGAVVAGATGLRTARRISHVFVLDVPAYPRMLLITDAAINVAPNARDKADIAQNAIDLAHVLGIDEPRVAILAAVETVNPDMQSTVDAAILCKMADRGQITGGLLDGPLAFDNAVSEDGSTHQEDRLASGRARQHPAGARPGGRQHDGQAVAVPGRRRQCRHRARRARAHRADQPGRFGALAPGFHGGDGTAGRLAAEQAQRGRLRPRASGASAPWLDCAPSPTRRRHSMAAESPSTALQLRSLVRSSGELEVSLHSVPVPEPGADEVLVRIEATPINPSDLGLLFGAADMSTTQVSGTAERPVLTARIPEKCDEGHGRPRRPVDAGRQRRRRHGRQGRRLARRAGAAGQDGGDHRRCDVRAVPLHRRQPVPGAAGGRHARPTARPASSTR